LKPDYEQAFLNLGAVYLRAGQFDEAADAFRKATTINPSDTEAFSGLGYASHKAKKYKEAVAALKEVLRVKPNDPQTHYMLGIVYVDLNDNDGFKREFAILKRLDPKLAVQLYNAVKK